MLSRRGSWPRATSGAAAASVPHAPWTLPAQGSPGEQHLHLLSGASGSYALASLDGTSCLQVDGDIGASVVGGDSSEAPTQQWYLVLRAAGLPLTSIAEAGQCPGTLAEAIGASQTHEIGKDHRPPSGHLACTSQAPL